MCVYCVIVIALRSNDHNKEIKQLTYFLIHRTHINIGFQPSYNTLYFMAFNDPRTV